MHLREMHAAGHVSTSSELVLDLEIDLSRRSGVAARKKGGTSVAAPPDRARYPSF
jgi:hypothetical protein